MNAQESTRLREVLGTIGPTILWGREHRMNEEATKMSLINPVLVALGWKTHDCTEVDYEFRPESADNPVDYALMIDRVPKLLVEAKALGSNLSDRKFVAQVLKYAFMADVTWCVLTDGDEYCIYNATASVKTDERLLCRFRVSENGEEYSAGKLALLSRSNLQSTDLESYWDEHFVDRQVRSTLQDMLRPQDNRLVGLIKKATKLTRKEIVESLCRLNITLDPPSQPGRLTGLRRGELASLTVGQLVFDGPQAYAELLAKDEKAGRGASIPLRADLVADLREHLAEELQFRQKHAIKLGEPVPARLPATTPLFDVPNSMVGTFDRDLAAAGIAKKDERGRTLDVHALRHTFGTHLSKAGVQPRVAQAAMRHSSIHLTMNVYTDPTLLDVGGAINALPDLSLHASPADRIVKNTGA